MDPYELVVSPEVARSKEVVFLSASGRTKSNVAAARLMRRAAAGTIAITADGDSPLAKAVDRVILLPYDYTPRVSGMASFTLMLVASARLLSPDLHADSSNVLSRGRRISRSLGLSNGGVTYFLGNGALYAIAIYSAAKLHEFFGTRAAYQRLEEFSHMEVFSLRRRDVVNIYEGFDPLKVGPALARSLKGKRYDSRIVSTGRLNDFERVLAAASAIQFAVLRWARGKKIGQPYLSRAEDKLEISDSMIY
jgi:hypothetical protein